MRRPRIAVSKTSPGSYTLSLVDRNGLTESDLITKLMQVYETVNPAARLPPTQQSGSEWQVRHQEGPVLFNCAAVDPKTGDQSSMIGGLVVSERRLAETLAKLRELGIEVSE